MASIFKRGACFWISYFVNGRQFQKSLHTKNERIARDQQKKLEYELTLGELDVASRLPLTMIVQEFCQHLQAKNTSKSWVNDFSRLRIFFGPICPALQLKPVRDRDNPGTYQPRRDTYAELHVQTELLEDITPELINRFIAARLRDSGWSPKTANSLREVLHRLFAFAIRHHGFRSRDRRYPNPAAGVERHREPAPEIRFLTLEQVEHQLKVLEPRPILHALVATYIYAGLRREEALWLTAEDVNLTTRLIHVRAKTVDGERWQPKTKRNRVVPISAALFAILSEYAPLHTSGWFFPSPTGMRWNPDNFYHDLRDLNEKHGLDWSCLDYRHTFGSHLAQKGESLYKIATLMGNSPDICRRHYAALIPEAMHATVEFAESAEANGPEKPAGGETAELLKELLAELRSGKDNTPDKPALRIAREEPA